jgi:hypothetical protein
VKKIVLGAIAVLAAVLALDTAILMTGLALIHHDWPAVPALGFVASFGVVMVVGVITAICKLSVKTK